MRKIVLDLAVTLDGFIEGPNGEIDWCIMDDDMNFEDFLSTIDTIFYGRASYELWKVYQPGGDLSESEKALMEDIYRKKKYVFSSSPKPDEPVTYISDNVLERIMEIKNEPGKDIWLYGGAKLIKTFVDLNLIDSYRLSIHPTILGSGKPLFENLEKRINLRLKEVNKYSSGVVQAIYENAP